MICASENFFSVLQSSFQTYQVFVEGKSVQFHSSTESHSQVLEIKEILNKLDEKEDEKPKTTIKDSFVNS